MVNKIFEEEQERLKKVIEIINAQIKAAKESFSKQEHFIIGFKEGMRGTQFTRQALMTHYATEAYQLERIVNNPYFGRFIFKSEDGEEVIYIGKKAIVDDKNSMIAYDWRSPICSMYYDFTLGPAEYQTGDEVKKGEIISKRQIQIKEGELLSVDEQDSLSDDAILIKYLSENNDSHLKSIVATIQSEQNKIIRSPLRKDYIVQGVAGSGKTTVALHRIAYLIYTEAKNISESEFMILGPNKYFLNYVAALLPDLDISNVSQKTFEEIALKHIKGKFKLQTQGESLKEVMSGSVTEDVISFKSSINYLKLLEKFLNLYILSHLKKPITFEGIVLFSEEELNEMYKSFSLSSSSYAEKINSYIRAIVKKTKGHADDICHDVWLRYRDEFLKLPKDSPRRKEILEESERISTEIKKGCIDQVKSYFDFIKINPIDLYKAFAESIDQLQEPIPVDVDLLKRTTIDKLEKKNMTAADLTAIFYLTMLINGVKDYENYQHLVIDEAQDLSLAQYYLLKRLFPKCNFDVFGDVHQSIYGYQGIVDWEDLNDIIFGGNAHKLNLNRSYRTTTQIFDGANLVLDYLGSEGADCLSRNGEEISVTEIDDKNGIATLVEQIKTLLEKHYESIAIIAKDEKEATLIYNKLKKLGIDIDNISEKTDKFVSGLCVIPTYLAKGLEFDAVILSNANDLNYTDTDIDMKLLYVALTRAMQEVQINYSGTISKPLSKLVRRPKDVARKRELIN